MTLPIYPDLHDTSVFITGGGSGIGAGLTEAFLRQGAKVAFVQRSDASEFCDAMAQSTGNRPLFTSCDITDPDAVRAAIEQAAAVHGPVQVLVNNAANDQRHTLAEVTPDFMDWALAINFKSYVFTAQAVIPAMQEMGGGAIINITSISYMMGNAGYPVYTAANSALNGLTRSLAREFGPDRIRVNALAPGWVMTPKQLEQWVTPDALAEHLKRQCLPDSLNPEDIAGGVLFLASNTSRAMTGQALVIDGGVVVTG
ncbi:SDR family NAD(P)-dependent oxidoreductase [Roseinatronobacter monicus]|uniref:NAD(P)-dependent dehydrogenase (Short-subunit alcohol dehydrogenase family) n=1 Tax=Roseinatronobacter monicus TaxID=393481 RepID=A0A543KCC3_9RHOB|nr:SDR family oxidoreductase [Roseinatronobacter monicus]TQM92733.1 NAD(P)-dependent dehydrogenase (short-subunit alcohol dehydrogenase family) [Roseinatronobacter monicus]